MDKHHRWFEDPVFEGEVIVDHGNKAYDYYKSIGMFPKSIRQVNVLVPEALKEREDCYYAICIRNPLTCKECIHFGSGHDLEFLIDST